jgi:hypothetical protein
MADFSRNTLYMCMTELNRMVSNVQIVLSSKSQNFIHWVQWSFSYNSQNTQPTFSYTSLNYLCEGTGFDLSVCDVRTGPNILTLQGTILESQRFNLKVIILNFLSPMLSVILFTSISFLWYIDYVILWYSVIASYYNRHLSSTVTHARGTICDNA